MLSSALAFPEIGAGEGMHIYPHIQAAASQYVERQFSVSHYWVGDYCLWLAYSLTGHGFVHLPLAFEMRFMFNSENGLHPLFCHHVFFPFLMLPLLCSRVFLCSLNTRLG